MIGDEAAKASWKQILKSCNMLNFDFYPVAELVASSLFCLCRTQITDGVRTEQTAIESTWFPNFDELLYKNE